MSRIEQALFVVAVGLVAWAVASALASALAQMIA